MGMLLDCAVYFFLRLRLWNLTVVEVRLLSSKLWFDIPGVSE